MGIKETEARNPKTKHIDRADTETMLRMIQEENENAVRAVNAALPEIAGAVDAIAERMKKGGRLFYIGAGTSGRLAVQDAAECPPTFGVSPDLVVAVMAGGKNAVFRAAEGEEDSAEAGRNDLLAYRITENDSVIGISASGGAAYVAGALHYAREAGAFTASVSSCRDAKIAEIAEVAIYTPTGAEVITGSTRMKAGTAQKMVLNMISTSVMVKTGKVYENLMINLRPTNIKLTARMVSIVSEITGADAEEARRLLDENGWNIRAAVEGRRKK